MKLNKMFFKDTQKKKKKEFSVHKICKKSADFSVHKCVLVYERDLKG